MTAIVLVNKCGTLQTINVKNISKNILYKKCNYRKSDGFNCQTTWVVSLGNNKHYIELWAKDNGRAGHENKYDFPPPCDTALYFGTCCVIKVNDEDKDCIEDLDKELWLKIYEKLFGGFEDLNDNDSDSVDELEEVPADMKTKDGYLKDGFVVDSTSDNMNDSDDNLCESASQNSSESDSDDEDSELGEETYSYTSDEN
jgi:hypothetical protein